MFICAIGMLSVQLTTRQSIQTTNSDSTMALEAGHIKIKGV